MEGKQFESLQIFKKSLFMNNQLLGLPQYLGIDPGKLEIFGSLVGFSERRGFSRGLANPATDGPGSTIVANSLVPYFWRVSGLSNYPRFPVDANVKLG